MFVGGVGNGIGSTGGVVVGTGSDVHNVGDMTSYYIKQPPNPVSYLSSFPNPFSPHEVPQLF